MYKKKARKEREKNVKAAYNFVLFGLDNNEEDIDRPMTIYSFPEKEHTSYSFIHHGNEEDKSSHGIRL